MESIKHILLVNSVDEDRAELCSLLESQKYQVRAVSSGLEAFDVLAEDDVDLVVTAVNIGEIDCWRLARFIRSGICRGLDSLPIIIVTHEWCGRITEITARDFGINQLLTFDQRHLLPEAINNNSFSHSPSLGKRRILVAISDPDNARLVKAILQARFLVELVDDAKAAWTSWQENRHNLVLLDLTLTGGADIELLRKIIAADNKQPVVMITAQGSVESAKQLMLQGATDIVIKPFLGDELRKVCELAVRREDYLVSHAQMTDRMSRLQQLRNRLGNIVDSMPSVLIGVDANGIVNLWNHHAETASKVSSESAIGEPLQQIWPDFIENDELRAALSQGDIRRLSKVVRQNGEKSCFYDMTIYPLYENTVVGAVIRIDDVTERALLEERIVQSEKMVSMGQLAAGMAHEINNPLAGVLQNTQVVRQRLTDRSTANLKAAEEVGIDFSVLGEYLERRDIRIVLDKVMDSGKRASQLIDNMLSFSRSDNSTMVLTDLTDLIDRSVELAAGNYCLQRNFDFRLIEIVREFADQLPLVECNPVQIQQVIFNLLMNGADAMEEKLQVLRNDTDEISYRPRFVLRTRLMKQQVRIEIEDNGLGMDEITQKKVFEPFYTTKEIGNGTGLGLSICYFLVTENHRGQLTVASDQQIGSRFMVDLPLVRS